MAAGEEYLKDTIKILDFLRNNGLVPILYGSVGVSLYLGLFKPQFNDIDLLVEDIWLESRWPRLQEILQSEGFALVDEHEHEFLNSEGIQVAFAKESVLTRDGIVESLHDIGYMDAAGRKIKTLTPEQFRRAYAFSVRDGYRRETRGKKDADVIRLLDDFLADAKAD